MPQSGTNTRTAIQYVWPFTMLLGNSISERLEPDVIGSLGASWNASACLVASAGSTCLPRRSVSPFGSSVPLMPVSGICCALGYCPSTWPPQPDCWLNGRLPVALPRMSAGLIGPATVAVAVVTMGVVVIDEVGVTVGVGVAVGVGVTVPPLLLMLMLMAASVELPAAS